MVNGENNCRAVVRAYAAYARAYAEIRQRMPGIRPEKAPFKKENCFFEIFVPKSDEISVP